MYRTTERPMIHRIAYTITAVLALIISAIPASKTTAAILHVPGTYPTIQAAVDASSAPGDSILVAPGAYSESVTLTDQVLHIIGTGGSVVTTVDGFQWTRQISPPSGFDCGGTIEGFEITGPFRFEFNDKDSTIRDVRFQAPAMFDAASSSVSAKTWGLGTT